MHIEQKRYLTMILVTVLSIILFTVVLLHEAYSAKIEANTQWVEAQIRQDARVLEAIIEADQANAAILGITAEEALRRSINRFDEALHKIAVTARIDHTLFYTTPQHTYMLFHHFKNCRIREHALESSANGTLMREALKTPDRSYYSQVRCDAAPEPVIAYASRIANPIHPDLTLIGHLSIAKLNEHYKQLAFVALSSAFLIAVVLIMLQHYLIAPLFKQMQKNIDQLEEQERMLATEHALNREYLDKIGTMLIILDAQGTIVMANSKAGEILGCMPEKMIGLNWFEHFLPPANASNVYAFFKRSVQGIEPLPDYFENEVLDRSGKTHLISWHNTMLYHSNSQAYGVICAGEDITERETLRSELLKNQEMMLTQARSAAMGEMLSLIAHQWRQPLGTISMSASALLADVALDQIEGEEIERQCQVILEQSQYLSRTIEDFRHFFKPKHKPETIRIAALLSELRQIIGKSLEYSSVALQTECDEKLEATLYARSLLQVLINLVRNAQDALTDRHTQDAAITLKATTDHGRLVITVCDNGPGIDPAIIDRIFEPYFTTKGEQSGTGLGLYISQMIVQKQLHGTIEAHNQAKGVCFTLAIPHKEHP